MPSFFDYQTRFKGLTNGRAKKLQSDMVANAAWKNDNAFHIAYFYDWYSDLKSDDKYVLRDLNSDSDENKIPMEVKIHPYSSQTYDKDMVTYHLELRPNQECPIDYYNEMYAERYNSIFPVGLYIDFRDNKDKWNRWMVVGTANYYENAFSTYELLPCDKVFQWIYKGVKYQMAGVSRSQSSYNSGVWTDFKIESPENQQKFLVPLNDVSENLFYNQRLIVDNLGIKSEPLAWKITKINRIVSKGIVVVTLAQDRFDQYKDYIETDSNGKTIGMWADYYFDGIEPKDNTDSGKTVSIVYNGIQNGRIKIGGNAKRFSAVFRDGNTEDGIWSFYIDDVDVNDLIEINTIDSNNIDVKFIGDDSYIGKDLTIIFESDSGIVASIIMNISAL